METHQIIFLIRMKPFVLSVIVLALLALSACDTNNPDSPQKVKYLIETSDWAVGTEPQYRKKTIYERGEDAKYLLSYSIYLGDELKGTYTCINEGDKEICLTSVGDTIRTIMYYDDARTLVKEEHRSDLTEYFEYDKNHHDRPVSYKLYMDGTLYIEHTYQYDNLMGYTEYYRGSDSTYVFRDTIWYTDNSYKRVAKRRSATWKDSNSDGLRLTYIQSIDCEYVKQGISKRVLTIKGTVVVDGPITDFEHYVTTYKWLDDLNVEYHIERTDVLYAYTTRFDGYNKYTY